MISRAITTIIAGTALLSACTEQPSPIAQTIFTGGVIYTADSTQSVAEAMAISGDKIIQLGTDRAVIKLANEKTRIVDLQGKMIIPGLHDVHIHLPGIVESDSCDLASKPYSLKEIVSRLKQCTQDLPAGEWLTVSQWSFTWGNEPSLELPTIRVALDAVSTEHPIVLLGNDGHHGAANSAALALAKDNQGVQVGLSRETLANQFADYRELVGTDASGEPNGTLNEDARKLVNVPDLWGYPDVDGPLVDRIAQRLASLGITSVLDAALTADDIDGFAQAAKESPFNWRMSVAYYTDFEQYRSSPDQAIDVDAIVRDMLEVQEKYSSVDNLKIDTAKIFIDGVIEGDPYANPPTLPNAAVLKPYLQPQFTLNQTMGQLSLKGYIDTNSQLCSFARELKSRESQQTFFTENGFLTSQCTQSVGVLEKEAEFLRDYTLALFDAGVNVHSHAIGDRAVRFALDTFEQARKRSPKSQATLSMAHVQLVHPKDIPRFGELKVFPAFTYAWIEPDRDYLMTVSPFIDQINNAEDLLDPAGYGYSQSYPAASIKAAGGLLTAGSDAPVDTRDPRPFFNLEKAVTRHKDQTGEIYNPNERIGLADALDAYTINGAKALRQDHLTGSLEPGKKADFVILNQNLLLLESQGRSDKISDTLVQATWFDGREIYRAE
jgi:predicted amidohydrolase YtcJ